MSGALVLTIIICGVACSGADDEQDPAALQAQNEEAGAVYSTTVVETILPWSDKVVARFAVELLPDLDAVGVATYNSEAGIADKICGGMVALITATEENSAGNRDSFANGSLAFARETLKAETANALIRLALGKPADERDQILAVLEVRGPAAGDAVQPPAGLEALSAGGWLDSDGQLDTPEPTFAVGDVSDEEWRTYLGWLQNSPRLLETATALTQGIDIKACAPDA